MPFDTPATENAERHAIKLTKRYLMKPFWVLLVPFLFPSALAAEPSLAETIQYIEAKLAANSPPPIRFEQTGQNITYWRDAVNNIPEMTCTFQLGALSTMVKVEGRRVMVSCTYGACISKKTRYKSAEGYGPETRTMVGGVTFYPGSNLERVQKALTHAIKLSGGKDELF